MKSGWDHGLATLWMGRLLRWATVVGRGGEVPVAAVILDGRGRSIGWGANRRERDGDPLGHGELVALRQAAALRGDWRVYGPEQKPRRPPPHGPPGWNPG